MSNPTGFSAQHSSIRADGSRAAIHPADVGGRFVRRRTFVYAVLIAIYVALPLVHINGHPAVHLDVAARRFYLFGATYNAQDFWLVLFLATTAGFGLLFATALAGRVWCGWACPQTVFLEGVYRRLERWVMGSRERRLRLKAGPWTAERVGRTVALHAGYLAVSLFLSHVALSLFVSAKDLAAMVRQGPAGHEVAFGWAVVTTGLLYFNFSWFREQLCIVVCPYGRLQSAMHDRDSVIIGYDVRRGEPRGKVRKGPAPALASPLPVVGDCVDCRRCVAVCPTGIDIRHGLQMECIGCAQCVDACDDVMDKLKRPRGLIRYDSLNGLDGKPKRVLRPRLLAYGGLLLASMVALGVSLAGRTYFEANLLRMRGAPYVLEGSTVRNQFELHLVNKRPEAATFRVEVTSPVPAQVVVPQPEVHLGSLESFRLPVFVTAERAVAAQPFSLQVTVTEVGQEGSRTVEARFLGPGAGGG